MGNAIEYNDKMHLSQRGVWRKRGITLLENICETASCVARGKFL